MRNEQISTPPGPAWKAAEDYGFDMSVVEVMLAKSPAQRLREHTLAVETALGLAEGMRKTRVQSRSSD